MKSADNSISMNEREIARGETKHGILRWIKKAKKTKDKEDNRTKQNNNVDILEEEDVEILDEEGKGIVAGRLYSCVSKGWW